MLENLGHVKSAVGSLEKKVGVILVKLPDIVPVMLYSHSCGIYTSVHLHFANLHLGRFRKNEALL